MKTTLSNPASLFLSAVALALLPATLPATEYLINTSTNWTRLSLTGSNAAETTVFNITDQGTLIFQDLHPSSGPGGAINLGAGKSLTIQPSEPGGTGMTYFTNNSVVAGANGGAINTQGSLMITNAVFELTGAFPSDSVAAASGAGIYQSGTDSYTELTNVTFRNLRAGGSTYGGGAAALGVNGKDAVKFGGAISFEGNIITTANGGAIRFNGNALFDEGSVATFTNNTATRDDDSAVNGGAVYVNLGNIDFKGDATFTGNAAIQTNATKGSSVGGALQNYGGSTAGAGGYIIFHQKAEFSDNYTQSAAAPTSSHGGAISIGANAGYLTFDGETLFTSNTAQGSGGAIHFINITATSGTLRLDGPASFRDNTAGVSGGAIFTTGQLAITDQAEFTGNTAATSGGAIYANTNVNVLLAPGADAAGDITFSGNIAKNGAATGTNNAIYFNATSSASSTLSIDTAAGRAVNFLDPISSNTGGQAITVTKDGEGTVLFDTHLSAIKASTTVNSGTFRLANNAAYGATTTAAASAFNLMDGATLDGTGSINAASTAAAGSTLNPGAPAAPGRLAFGNTLALDGATLRFDLFNADGADPAAYDTITAASITAGALNTIDIASVKTGAHTYDLIATDTPIAGTVPEGYNLTINGIAPTARYQGSSLVINGDTLQLNAQAINLVTLWTGANPDAPDLWADGPTQNWLAQLDANETNFNAGDSVQFDDTALTRDITIAPAGVTVSDMAVTNSAGRDYTLSGSGAITADPAAATGLAGAPAGKLTKDGDGALNFTNTATNTFAGGIDLRQGALGITHASQIDTTGAAINFTGTATLRLNADIPLLSNKLNASPGAHAIIDTAGHALSYDGDLSGIDPAATLVKTGAGALSIDGDHSNFSATIRVDTGSLLLANAATTLSGAITANAPGVTIGGVGAFTGNINLNAGTLLVGLDAPADTLAITGALAATADSRFTFQLHDNQTSARLNLAGPLTGVVPDTTIINLDFSHITANASGTYILGSGITTLADAKIYLNGVLYEEGSRQNATLQITPDTLLEFIYGTDTSRYMTWTGAAGDNIWNSDGSANWIGSDSKTRFLAGDIAIFQGHFDNTPVDIQGAAAKVTELDINNTGTLTFTGLGISAATTYATGTEVTGSAITGKLVKTGDGALHLANTANSFSGGIQIGDTDATGGILAFSTAAQLGATQISFAGTGTLRPLATTLTLVNNLYLAPDATGAIDTSPGSTITLSGATSGAGTLLKTGPGTLVYSGAAALGHAATNINDGVLRLADISTSPVSPLHTFILDGGWLDLSDTPYVSTGSTTNNWQNLTLDSGPNASSGGVIGSNDAITLRDGDTAFDIGSPDNPEKRGLFVIIDAGPGGAATLSGSNNYIGYTRLDSGLLRVTSDAQLGDATLAREVIINGGTLAIGATFDTARKFELRATGGVAIDSGASTTWAAIDKNAPAPVTFVKDGPGALAISGPNAADTLHVKAGTYTALTLDAVGAGDITVDTAATMNIDTASTGTLSNNIAGTGTLAIASGDLALGGATTIANIQAAGATTKIRAAATTAFGNASTTLTLADAAAILAVDNLAAGHLRMSGNASLLFHETAPSAYYDATFTSLSGSGLIKLYTNLSLSQADHLTLTAPSTGDFKLSITNTGPSPTGERVGVTVPVITVPTSPVNFQLVDQNGNPATGIDAGMYRYGLQTAQTDGTTTYNLAYTGQFSSLGATINQMTAVMPLSWFAELDTLQKRMGELHFDHDAKPGAQLWLRAHTQQFDFDSDVTGAPFTERQYGATAGYDYTKHTPARSTTLGLFLGYAQADHDTQPRSSATSESLYGGGYLTILTRAGWYLDATLKYNSFDNTFDISYYSVPVAADYNNYALGGSLEAGRRIPLGKTRKWTITPQAQIALAYLSPVAYVTTNDIDVRVASGWSIQERAGALLAYTHQDKQDALFTPYVKLNVAAQQTTGLTLTASGGSWDPALDGARLEIGAGFTWAPSKRTHFYLDYEYACADAYTKPYGLNIGIRHLW